MSVSRPKVGTAVIIVKDEKVLMESAKAPRRDLVSTGGHLELGNVGLASVETMEEAGIEIQNVRFVGAKQQST